MFYCSSFSAGASDLRVTWEIGLYQRMHVLPEGKKKDAYSGTNVVERHGDILIKRVDLMVEKIDARSRLFFPGPRDFQGEEIIKDKRQTKREKIINLSSLALRTFGLTDHASIISWMMQMINR